MSFWSQVGEIARVDLVVERRVGESLKIVLPFAVIALFVFPIALGLQLSSAGRGGSSHLLVARTPLWHADRPTPNRRRHHRAS